MLELFGSVVDFLFCIEMKMRNLSKFLTKLSLIRVTKNPDQNKKSFTGYLF